MARPVYQVLLLSDSADADWRARVIQAVMRDASTILGEDPPIEWLDATTVGNINAETSAAAVLLATSTLSGDKPTMEALDRSADQALPILPVVRIGGTAEADLPTAYKHLNAYIENDHDPDGVSRAILRLLGITDRLRNIFISYRRTETTGLAEQLHTELSHRGFTVFLDRFGVDLADDFQRRIDIELCDKAFLLLLESPGISDSPWVHHEITYAQANHLGLLALTLPGTLPNLRVPTVDDGSRWELASDSLEGGTLAAASLAGVLGALELEHSRLMRTRREYLLGSLRNYLVGHGCDISPVDEWALLASAESKVSEIFSVTPSSPDIEDLWRAEQLRLRLDGSQPNGLRATVVHDADALDHHRAEVFDWVGSVSGLAAALLRSKPGVLEEAP